MSEKIYVNRKDLKISSKKFQEMMKKDPGSAEILKKHKEMYEKLAKDLREEK